MTADVGIAGAGVLGRLLAWSLARSGWKVTLYEKEPRSSESGCSWVGAGMLAPVAELDYAEPLVADLGMLALDLWPQILAALPLPVYFQQNGSLVVAHRQDRAELIQFQRRIGFKKPGAQLYQTLDRHALQTVEPEISTQFNTALFFPSEGQLEPRQLLPALLEGCLQLGVELAFGMEVQAIQPHQLVFADQVKRHEWIIDATGFGARKSLSDLRGVRGELLRLKAPEVQLNRPVRLMHPRYPLYMVPRPEHHYLVGATMIESESMRGVSVRSSLELLSAAYSVHPGFAEAEILQMQAHVRPAFKNNLPKVFFQKGLLRVNGLFRHGFLLTPVLAEAVVKFMQSGVQHHASELWEEEVYAATHSER